MIHSLAIAVALLAAILPQPDSVVRDSCDLIELNHFYDDQGRLVFDQVIFWDWSDDEGRYNVRAWRLVKNPTQLPQRDWNGGGYSALWIDGEQTLRRVHCAAFTESWTQHDPELAEREFLSAERRRPLRIAKGK